MKMMMKSSVLALLAFASTTSGLSLQPGQGSAWGGSGPATSGEWALSSIAAAGEAGAKSVQRLEGNTRKTFLFGDIESEVVQVGMKTEGRPLSAEIELWIGPNWTPYTVKAFSDDGYQFPLQMLVGTRNKSAQLETRNTGPYEMPISVAASYATPGLVKARSDVPLMEQGHTVQGGGAVYSVPTEMRGPSGQTRVFLRTDSRQLHAKVELLNGPNNIKQCFEIFTNNGVLNSFFCVLNTPGPGMVRITNIASLEFPCYAYVAPFV